MRYLASLSVLLAAAAVGSCSSSCSSSSSSSSSSGAPAVTDCGPGPYAKVIGHVIEATATGVGRSKEGVVVTFSMCPDKPFTSDADGTVTANITKGTPTIFRAEHPDDIPSYFGEWKTDADFEGSIQVVPKLFQGIVAPDFTPDKTLIAFGVSYPAGTFDAGVPDGGPTDPCQRNEGVTFTIPGHPEAKVVYFTTDSIPKPDPKATATSTNGVASVTGLADGIWISPVAAKPGCHLTATHDGFTGRAQLAKGYGVIISLIMTK